MRSRTCIRSRARRRLDFDVGVPPLPAGRYRVYGDIVHESGYAQTLVSQRRSCLTPSHAPAPTDADDSWFSGSRRAGGRDRHIRSRRWLASGLGAGRAAHCRRRRTRPAFLDPATRPEPMLTVEPYMGMAAHLDRREPRWIRLRASASVRQHFDGGAAELRGRRRRARTPATR